MESAALVLYDETCRFCTAVAEALERHGLPVAPIGSRLGETWLRDLDRRERYAAFHAVDRAGRRFSGGNAVPLVLESLPYGRLPAAASRRLPRPASFGYALVSRNRSTLSRLLGSRVMRARFPNAVRRASRARAG